MLRTNVVLFILAVLPLVAAKKEQTIDKKIHHLRSGGQREWSEFPERAEGDKLALEFTAEANGVEQTLRLRQRDVKQPWRLLINGREVGRLSQDENDRISFWSLPAGLLTAGLNRLEILPASDRVDDILVGDIRLHNETVAEAIGESTAELTVVDGETGRPLPCRITIVDANGSLLPVKADASDRLAVTTGMIYTAGGTASFRLPAGDHSVYASRGFEYSVATARLSFVPGKTITKQLEIRRELSTPGYVSCDTHTHTLTYSGHGDASLAQRVVTIAGEGIEMPIATDHNVFTDYRAAAAAAGIRSRFTPVTGSEVTTRVGHFNVFPVQPGAAPIDPAVSNWRDLFLRIQGTPGVQVVVLNHPRDLHLEFRPFGPEHHKAAVGENIQGWVLEANAMEVVNSGALQSDPMLLFRDWFGLLNRGYRIAPVGSSDSHDIGRKLVGQARTYIATPDADPGNIAVEEACRSFRDGRVLVSMGLLTEITVDGKYKPGDLVPAQAVMKVSGRVQGPSWTSANKVELFANGVKIREQLIPANRSGQNPSVIKWQGEWVLQKPAHDIHLVAIALGPGVTAPYWRIPKPYQPASLEWTPYVIGATGAIWIDADGDGKFSSAYGYATRIVRDCGEKSDCITKKLTAHDEAVASQVANLLKK
jgi:hypothetical protein